METETLIEPVYLRPPAIARQCAVDRRTVYRWMDEGVEHRGRRVKLAFVRVGGVRRVEPEAWEAFIEALNDGPVKQPDQERQEKAQAAADARRVRKRLKMT